MKRRLYFQPLYFLFWVLYFIVARGVFLLYHSDRSAQLSLTDIASTFLYGLRLDFSFTAYSCALPFLAALLAALWPRFGAASFIRYYTFALLAFLSLLLAIDLELYTFWGFRLDATPLQYLNTPAEMAASAAVAPLFLLLLVAWALSAGFMLLYLAFFDLRKYGLPGRKGVAGGFSLLCLALLVLPMRGGWQLSPVNQSMAYFSTDPFANHASLNMPWNLMDALLKYGKQRGNPYQYMPPEQAAQKVQALYAAVPDSSESILTRHRPNVLFIILESFTAKFIGHLGGEPGVTPVLDSLAAAGISFTDIYASGDRSQKGIVALLSGYPAQTITSIIKTPTKTERLPHLGRVLKEQGYRTSFYYGGELEFANIKSYLLNGGYDRLIDKYDFPASSYNSKWGAHDHVLLARVQQDLKQERQPFFSTVYTLSSHEPFEIPVPAKFPGNDNGAKFRNSVHYTDWALGKFVAEASRQPWWPNTLVVLVADHGHTLPDNELLYLPGAFRIPFILTGGAMARQGLEIDATGSQTDVAATLLAQLQLPYQAFGWSRNLMAPTAYPFAFYAFSDGFGFVTPTGNFTMDNIGQALITAEGASEGDIDTGKAYMQHSFEDFLEK